jgi:hypothetical protein
LASDDLNMTLLAWQAHEGVADHVNEERDVLLIGIKGSGSIRIDGVEHPFEAGHGILVEKGRRFGIVASEAGLRYLSIHVRRPPLQLAPLG